MELPVIYTFTASQKRTRALVNAADQTETSVLWLSLHPDIGGVKPKIQILQPRFQVAESNVGVHTFGLSVGHLRIYVNRNYVNIMYIFSENFVFTGAAAVEVQSAIIFILKSCRCIYIYIYI